MTKAKKESFMQGVLALMVSQVLIKLLGLIYKLYLTNRPGFGDTGNAIYSAGFQIYALLLTLSSIGVPNAVSKLVSEKTSIGDHRGAHRTFMIAFATFAAIGFIGSLLLFIGAGYIANVWLQIPEAQLTLVALSPSIFFVAIISVIRGFFNGRGSMRATANSQTIEQLAKTLLTVIVVEIVAIFSTSAIPEVKTTYMAAGANLATTLATAVSFLYLYAYYKVRRRDLGRQIRNSIKCKRKSSKRIMLDILAVSIPMSLSSVLASLNKNIDSMTVVRGLKTFMTEEAAKAQYGILGGKVDTLTTLPLSFNVAFATALVPAIAAAKASGDMKNGAKRISFSLLVTMIIGLPCTVGLILFAQPILNLLFPNANQGAFIFQVSASATIFVVLEQTVNGALQGLGKTMIPAVALSIGVATKLLLNLILIPIEPSKFIFGGTAGAAIGTTVCHIIALSIGFSVLRKNMRLKLEMNKFVIKPFIATTMMGICCYFIYITLSSIIAERLATIIAIVFAVILYGLAIIVLKVFTKEEILMIPYGQKIYKILEKIGLYKQVKTIRR